MPDGDSLPLEAASPKPSPGSGWALTAAGSAVLLGALDAYVVVGVLVDIVHSMAIPVNRLERATPIITGYLLGYVAAMPLLGQISDRYGRKPLLQGCLAAFALGSAVTALASSLPILVSGRVLQGAAAGALLPVTFALVADLRSEDRRATSLGVLGAAQEVGSVLGALYGVAIASLAIRWSGIPGPEYDGWRWIFWINLPLSAAAMAVIWRAVPAAKPLKARRVDLVGGLLLSSGLALLVVGLYNPEPARSALPTWGFPILAGAAALLVAFVLWERRSPVRLVQVAGHRGAALATILAVSLLSGAALMVTLVDVELFAQTVLDKNSAGAALILLPFLAALPIGAVLGGRVSPLLGERWMAVLGLALAAVGYVRMSLWNAAALEERTAGLPTWILDLVLAGVGLGLVIAPLAAAVLRIVPSSDSAVASAAVIVARTSGMLIGVAALTAWGLHRFSLLTANLDTPLPFGMDDAEYAIRLEEYDRLLQQALVIQYAEIFRITAVLVGVAAVLALFLPGAHPSVRHSRATSGTLES
jgi:MFS family permease